jgi:hypothetical protein
MNILNDAPDVDLTMQIRNVIFFGCDNSLYSFGTGGD